MRRREFLRRGLTAAAGAWWLALPHPGRAADNTPLPAANADTGNPPSPPSASVFPVTFWAIHYWKYNPAYDKVTSDEQYRLIKECNFNLVMGGPLKKAERYGLQCMSDALVTKQFRALWWPPHNPPVTEKHRREVIEALRPVDRTSPALWGYFLGDEPRPVLYPVVKALRQIIKSVDPARPVFENLFPGSDPEQFIAAVNPDLCAYDHYPVFEDGVPRDNHIPPGFDNTNFLNDLARFRRDCLRHRLKYLPTMLACGHSLDYEVKGVHYHRDYGHITEARLRWQAYSALAYNAGGIAWFIYFSNDNPKYEEAAIGRDWKPTRIYGWLQQVNREAAAIGAILQGLRSVGAYESEPVYCYKGRHKKELDRFPAEGLIRGVEGGLVSCGEFEDERGGRYLVIVNRNVDKSIRIRPLLHWEHLQAITRFDRERCRWSDKPVWRRGDAPLYLDMAPGDGTFLRVRA